MSTDRTQTEKDISEDTTTATGTLRKGDRVYWLTINRIGEASVDQYTVHDVHDHYLQLEKNGEGYWATHKDQVFLNKEDVANELTRLAEQFALKAKELS